MYCIVFVTVPNIKVAKKIAKGLLNAKLAACVNIINRVYSLFWWQGKIDSASELLLIIKTRKSLFIKLSKLVTKLHPYTTAEVISLPLVGVIPKYRRWLDANLVKSS
jgi:periplasmic divalent cation tolerance protein